MTTLLNLGIIGCGDVAFRTYFPGIRGQLDRATVGACFDPLIERAERAAALFPGATASTTLDGLLAHAGLDAVFNLTPAPFHRETTAAALDAGLHVFSEKPLAATIAEADALIDQATSRDRLLLCAPAVMATSRFAWLKQIIASGRIGQPTLATGQMANMGPASWRGYTGDPAVFYAPGVGPLLDTGVYVLHGITGLMGPARRAQSFGGIAIPRRQILIERLAGQLIDVATNDVMLVHLDFGENRFAQILSSFAVPASKAAAIELHCTNGSICIGADRWYEGSGPVDLYQRDESPLGLDGWLRDVAPPNGLPEHLIQAGPRHFIDCLTSAAQPTLTPEHARHVLEIILKAGESIQEGRAIELETTF